MGPFGTNSPFYPIPPFPHVPLMNFAGPADWENGNLLLSQHHPIFRLAVPCT